MLGIVHCKHVVGGNVSLEQWCLLTPHGKLDMWKWLSLLILPWTPLSVCVYAFPLSFSVVDNRQWEWKLAPVLEGRWSTWTFWWRWWKSHHKFQWTLSEQSFSQCLRMFMTPSWFLKYSGLPLSGPSMSCKLPHSEEQERFFSASSAS